MSLNYSFNKRETLSEKKSLTYYDTYGHARNVCFVQASGTTLFLNYTYLISGEFSPEEDTITITFTTHIVTLQGHNLGPVCDSLAVQSLQHITTVDERYAATEEETASYVTHIDVKPL
jgi:hypothetical protein